MIEPEPPLFPGHPDPIDREARARAIDNFAEHLGLDILERVVQRGRDPQTARYTLELSRGRRVHLGTIKELWSQAAVGQALAVTVGVVPTPCKSRDWKNALAAIITHATDVEEAEGEGFESVVREWAAKYTERFGTGDRKGAAPQGLPFREEGKVFLTAGELAKFIRREYSERVDLHRLRLALTDIGAAQKTVSYQQGQGAKRKVSSTSYYRIQESDLEGVGSEDE